ncbi:hypothetical protein pb186bvf_008026 [Paramecium bursaria]
MQQDSSSFFENLSKLKCGKLNNNNNDQAQHIDNISFICLEQNCKLRFQGYCVKCDKQKLHPHQTNLISDIIQFFDQMESIKDPVQDIIALLNELLNKIQSTFSRIIKNFEHYLIQKQFQMRAFQNKYFRQQNQQIEINFDQLQNILSELEGLLKKEDKKIVENIFSSSSSQLIKATNNNKNQQQISQILNSSAKELQKLSDSLQNFKLGKEITKKTILRFGNLDDPISKNMEIQNTVSSCFEFQLKNNKQLKSINVLGIYMPKLKRQDNSLKIQVQVRKNIIKSNPLFEQDIQLIHDELIQYCPAYEDRYFIEFKNSNINLQDKELIIISIKPYQKEIQFCKFKSEQNMEYLIANQDFLRQQNEFINDQIIGGFFVQENYD